MILYIFSWYEKVHRWWRQFEVLLRPLLRSLQAMRGRGLLHIYYMVIGATVVEIDVSGNLNRGIQAMSLQFTSRYIAVQSKSLK